MQSEFPCEKCGGRLAFEPGSYFVKCRYCGRLNDVPDVSDKDRVAAVQEQDLPATLASLRRAEESALIEETKTIACGACAAEFSWDDNVHADKCPFCGADIVTSPQTDRHIKPQAIIPFQLDEKAAQECLRDWLSSLWYAPKKKMYSAYVEGKLVGMYVPYWTFDARTVSSYEGERGVPSEWSNHHDDAPKMNWHPVTGNISLFFDDVLVLATGSLPESFAQNLKDWDLKLLEPYRDEFLAGYRSEIYQMDLETGYGHAREHMEKVIVDWVHRDINAVESRVHNVRTDFYNLRFKHILLPVWINAYRYGGKSYHFLVNGQTGEVQGEYPVDWFRVGSFIFIVLLIAWVFAFYTYFDK